METILTLTYLYLLVLLIALLIERTMEVLMAIWEFVELKFEMHRVWNRRANRLKNTFAGKVLAKLESSQILNMEIDPRTRQYTDIDRVIKPGATVVFSAASVRHVVVRTAAFIITTTLGVMLCNWADINLVRLVKDSIEPATILMLDAVGPRIQLIASGLIVGLGAEPVHRMIKRLEATKAWLERRNQLNEKLASGVEQTG